VTKYLLNHSQSFSGTCQEQRREIQTQIRWPKAAAAANIMADIQMSQLDIYQAPHSLVCPPNVGSFEWTINTDCTPFKKPQKAVLYFDLRLNVLSISNILSQFPFTQNIHFTTFRQAEAASTAINKSKNMNPSGCGTGGSVIIWGKT